MTLNTRGGALFGLVPHFLRKRAKERFPPAPLYKERERKKTKEKTNKQIKKRKYMQTSSFFENIESRKAKFWQQCCACAARHPEWPKDGVEDFFMYWTAVNR